MIDLAYFEEDAAEAGQILRALTRGLSAAVGHPSVARLVGELDAVTSDRILELESAAFGPHSDVLGHRALAEIAADPDALLVVVEIAGAVEGFLVGYYERPGEEMVEGASFFLDTLAVSERWRGLGVASLAIAGLLLLVRLTGDVARVGLAVWAGNADRLAVLYRRVGFADTFGRRSSWRCMSVELDEDHVATWRAQLGLPPGPVARIAGPAGAGG